MYIYVIIISYIDIYHHIIYKHISSYHIIYQHNIFTYHGSFNLSRSQPWQKQLPRSLPSWHQLFHLLPCWCGITFNQIQSAKHRKPLTEAWMETWINLIKCQFWEPCRSQKTMLHSPWRQYPSTYSETSESWPNHRSTSAIAPCVPIWCLATEVLLCEALGRLLVFHRRHEYICKVCICISQDAGGEWT